jgi:hypothetical protein
MTSHMLLALHKERLASLGPMHMPDWMLVHVLHDETLVTFLAAVQLFRHVAVLQRNEPVRLGLKGLIDAVVGHVTRVQDRVARAAAWTKVYHHWHVLNSVAGLAFTREGFDCARGIARAALVAIVENADSSLSTDASLKQFDTCWDECNRFAQVSEATTVFQGVLVSPPAALVTAATVDMSAVSKPALLLELWQRLPVDPAEVPDRAPTLDDATRALFVSPMVRRWRGKVINLDFSGGALDPTPYDVAVGAPGHVAAVVRLLSL